MKAEKWQEAFEKVCKTANAGEELKPENFNRVNKDGFEKAVILLKKWMEMIMEVLMKNRSFRIEIIYNAETEKTNFAVYTPTKSESDDIF